MLAQSSMGMVTKCTKPRAPGTNTKRSQIVFAVTSIALSSERVDTQLLGPINQYRIILCGGSDPGASDPLHKILYICTQR